MEEPKVVIEKGIPIPPGRTRGGKFSHYFEAAKNMAVGDSIVIPGAKRQQSYVIQRVRDFTPQKYVTRMIDTDKLRVWRVK